jgi:uncharacterized protein
VLTVVHVLVGVLLVLGLLGTLVPFLPGTALILGAAFVFALATGFEPIGAGRLLLLLGLTALAEGLDYAARAIGARRAGGSRWAVAGALAGGVIGLVFGLPGLLLGPVVGAVAGELLRQRTLEASVRVGAGTLAGMVAGALAKFALGTVMVGLFAWWAWRG